MTMILSRIPEGLECGGPLAILHSRPNLMVLLQIYYYADQIYLSAGVKSNDVQYVTAGTGAVNVFMTMVTVSAHEAMVP